MLDKLRSHVKRFVTVFIYLSFAILRRSLVYGVFVPDEYWQGPEPGFRWYLLGLDSDPVTWEFKARIRSPLYPLIFTLGRFLFSFLKVHKNYIIDIISILMCTIWDLSLDSLCKETRNKTRPIKLLFIMRCNWFAIFVQSRPLIQVLESILILALFLSTKNKKPLQVIVYTALGLMLRITFLFFIISLMSYFSFRFLLTNEKQDKQLIKLLSVGIILGILSEFLLSSYIYKSFTSTLLFFTFANSNINIVKQYGVHSIMWYILVALPLIILPNPRTFFFVLQRLKNQVLKINLNSELDKYYDKHSIEWRSSLDEDNINMRYNQNLLTRFSGFFHNSEYIKIVFNPFRDIFQYIWRVSYQIYYLIHSNINTKNILQYIILEKVKLYFILAIYIALLSMSSPHKELKLLIPILPFIQVLFSPKTYKSASIHLIIGVLLLLYYQTGLQYTSENMRSNSSVLVLAPCHQISPPTLWPDSIKFLQQPHCAQKKYKIARELTGKLINKGTNDIVPYNKFHHNRNFTHLMRVANLMNFTHIVIINQPGNRELLELRKHGFNCHKSVFDSLFREDYGIFTTVSIWERSYKCRSN